MPDYYWSCTVTYHPYIHSPALRFRCMYALSDCDLPLPCPTKVRIALTGQVQADRDRSMSYSANRLVICLGLCWYSVEAVCLCLLLCTMQSTVNWEKCITKWCVETFSDATRHILVVTGLTPNPTSPSESISKQISALSTASSDTIAIVRLKSHQILHLPTTTP